MLVAGDTIWTLRRRLSSATGWAEMRGYLDAAVRCLWGAWPACSALVQG
jgi:hypothetical protein